MSTASVAQAVRKRRGCLSGWHSLLRQSGNVVGVCLGGIHRRWRRRASVDQILWERRGCLSGWNSPDEEYRIRRPGSPETSWVSDWVAIVGQPVRERRGCLSGWHSSEMEEGSFRRPDTLGTSWMSVWLEFTRGGGVPHPSPRQSGNVVSV